jgi:hypothetical protein
MHSARTVIAAAPEMNIQSEEALARYFSPKDKGTKRSKM